MKKRYIIFIVSLLLNALGNAFMLKGNVGSTPWTAAFGNVSNYFNITPGTASIIISILFFIISKIIGKDFKLFQSIICLIASSSYGLVTDFYLAIIGREQSAFIVVNYLYAFLGVILVAMAVSFAIQANIAYLALDDFLKNLKFYICKGNIALATFASSFIAISMAVVTGLLFGEVENITVLTLLVAVFLGVIVSFFDRIFVFKFEDIKN